MRKIAVVASAVVAVGMLGMSGYAFATARAADERSGPQTVVQTPAPTPTVVQTPAPTPVGRPCEEQPAYISDQPQVHCSTETRSISDPRTGGSYTTTVTAEVCRQETTGDECIGTTQSVGRTGAEADPSVSQSGTTAPLPQACVGATCVGGGSLPVPSRITVFDSGTTPEANVYTAGGVVNVNAPQVCASLDNSCGGADPTGSQRAGVENFNLTQVVTTN